MPRFRFDIALSLARGVKAFVILEGRISRGTVPKVEQKERTEKEKFAPYEVKGKHHTAKERTEGIGRKTRGNRARQEIVTKHVSDEQRDRFRWPAVILQTIWVELRIER